MVYILSRGTSTDSILLRKELPLGMLLVDVVVVLQPLSPTTFGTEARIYFGRFILYIRGLLLWPIPLDHGLPRPL